MPPTFPANVPQGSADAAHGLVGSEWIIDAFDCDPNRLRELNSLRQLCDEVIQSLGLNVVQEPMWYQFPGHAGITGLYLLSESHLACHTYPEFGLATFNLYCCRDLPAWPWTEALANQLTAGRVEVVKVARGRGQAADPRRADRPSHATASRTGEEGSYLG